MATDRPTNDWILKIVGILASVAILMSGSAIGWMFSMTERVTTVELKQEADERQDRRMDFLEAEMTDTHRKFWRLHSWARDRINEERVARSENIESWPDI